MMTQIDKSCGVAFSLRRNHATSELRDATMGATTLQSTILKALACKVLRRNQERNSAATSQKSESNFSAEIDPPPATSVTAAEICRGCSRFEVVEIFGKPVAGCLYVATGHYVDGWKRLPADLQKCLHE